MHVDVRLHLEPVPGEPVAAAEPGRGAISLAPWEMILPWPSHVAVWIQDHQYEITAVERVEGGTVTSVELIRDVEN